MTTNAETPRAVTGAFPEDSAVGGASAATVAQPRRHAQPGRHLSTYSAERPVRGCWHTPARGVS